MPPTGTGTIAYLSDEDENFGRVSTIGRAYFSESYSKVKKHSPINVTSASGGSTFNSVLVGRVQIYNQSGNGVMWWGGTGDDAPYSGRGMPLWGGERTGLIPVTNFNSIRVAASVSGQIIYAIGFLNGRDIALDNTAVATTPIPVEFVSPLVISHSPASGFSGVAFNSEITATFNEAISQGSVTSGSFKLSPAHNVTVFRDIADTTKIVMTPNVDLSGSTVYYAGINSQVTDLAGNSVSGTSGGFNFTWPFTTAATPPPPDVTAPVVSGTSPVSGATNINGTTDVTITFSESMLSGSITPLNIYLSYLSGVAATAGISGIVSLAVDAKTVTVDPTPSFLSGSANVKINVLSGCRDLAGNNLAAHDRSRNFTIAVADVTAPVVSGTTPASGATSVGIEDNTIIVFSEQMLSGTINSTNIYLSTTSGAAAGAGVAASVSLDAGDQKTVTVNPSNSLNGSTVYHINVTTGVQDLAANSMAAIDRSRYFTTTSSFTEIYNVTGSGFLDIGGGRTYQGGSETITGACTLNNTIPKKVTLKLMRQGSPTGTATIAIIGVSDFIEIGTIDVSTLTTSFVEYTFTNLSQSYTMVTGDKICILYDGGNSSNYIFVQLSSSDVYSGARVERFLEPSWVFTAAQDLVATIYS